LVILEHKGVRMPFKYNPFLGNLSWWECAQVPVRTDPHLFPHSVDGSMELIEVFNNAKDIYEKFTWTHSEWVDVVLDTVWPNTVLIKFNGVLGGVSGTYLFPTPMKRVYILALYYIHNTPYEFRVEVTNATDRYSLRKLCPEGVLQIFSTIGGTESVLQEVTFPNSIGYKLCSLYAGRVPRIKQSVSLKSESAGPICLNTSDSALQYFTGCDVFFHPREAGNDLEVRIIPPLIIRGTPA